MNYATFLDWFDQVYIVNLTDRTDRRDETIAEFARVGVSIPNDKVKFFKATRPTEKGEFPSIGSLGNFISQTRVLKDAMEHGHDRILICEDDLHLNQMSEAALKAVMHDLQTTNWNISLLGYLEPEDPPTGHVGLTLWDGGTLGVQFWAARGAAIQGFHDYLNLVRARPSGHPDGGSMFFDGAFNMVRTQVPGISFRIATPCMAGQRASRTDIHDLKFFDRVEPFRSVVGAMRKLKNRKRRA